MTALLGEIMLLREKVGALEAYQAEQALKSYVPAEKAVRESWDTVHAQLVLADTKTNILQGLSSQEILSKFGPPDSKRAVESGIGWFYNYGDGVGWDVVRIDILEGSVVRVKFYDNNK
jgi:hypothetical protein